MLVLVGETGIPNGTLKNVYFQLKALFSSNKCRVTNKAEQLSAVNRVK